MFRLQFDHRAFAQSIYVVPEKDPQPEYTDTWIVSSSRVVPGTYATLCDVKKGTRQVEMSMPTGALRNPVWFLFHFGILTL